MLKSMEFSGKTIDDAVATAAKTLGLSRDDFTVEIVERGKSGFLGIGAVNAVIRASYEAPDEPKPVAEKKSVPEKKPAAEKKPAEKAPVKPWASEITETAPASSDDADKSRAKKRDTGAQAEETEKFLKGLLEHMGVEADIEISPRHGGGLNVNLTGSGIGAVIGRRGETLDAIQHLANYAVNHGSDKRAHINVDAENYRAKREESLINLAKKMAEKSIKYQRSMALEPMNSYERHVIHAALQDFEGVTTSSTGTEPNRRVVISYVRQEAKKPASDYKEWC